jgi:sugar lactone lactonase YvrE
MRNFILACIVFTAFSCTKHNQTSVIITKGNPSTDQLLEYWNKAFQALSDTNYNDYLAYAEKVYSYASDDFGLKILYTDALMSNDHSEKAIEIMESLISLHSHLTYNRLQREHFQFIKKLDKYEDYLSATLKDTEAINNSSVAYVINEKDLIPEGVAFDDQTKTLYVSSINKRKIISINKEGIINDFIETGQDNILAVLGMEVDPARRHLWVCSEWDNPRKIIADSLLHTSIYKYDIENQKLIKKYVLRDTSHRLLNDLTISSDGTVYITESLKGKVYVIRPEIDSLELFIDSDHYYYANGITISDDDKNLYVSHFGETVMVDLKNNIIKELKHPENISTGRNDGLAFYKNSLIMHQDEICRYYLNEAGDSIIKKEVIERNNPLFEIPTTGEIADDKYFYIANSQLTRFDAEGFAFPDEKLDSVYILKTVLK